MTRTQSIVSRVGALAAFVVALTVFPTIEASAAGGGCRNWDFPGGVSFAACIGDDGVTVYGDAYINNSTSGCYGIDLQVYERIGVWHYPRRYAGYGCQTGHIGPLTYPMTTGNRYYTRVTVLTYSNSYSGTSPESWR